MIRTLYLLLLLCINSLAFSQISKSIELNRISLIGMTDLEDQGFVLLSTTKEKQQLGLQLITNELESKWQVSVDLDKLSGYAFYKAYVGADNERLELLLDDGKQLRLINFSLENGKLLQDRILTSGSTETSTYRIHRFTDRTEIYLDGSKRYLSLSPDTEEMKALDIDTPGYHYGWIGGMDDRRYSYKYKPSTDHGLMHLDLRYDMGDSTVERYYELELEHSSFTYHSTVDKELLSFRELGGELYAIGKLDFAFEGRYPSTKLSDAFSGIWIARFDKELELVYFSEIPFQYFDGMISLNVISKPAVMDLKLDLQGNLLFAINELRQVLYGKKYMITIDENGKHQGLAGGMDSYNFFEYNRQGLRRQGNKLHFRLMDDDWSYFANSSLHFMGLLNGYHSAIFPVLQNMAKNSSHPPAELCYTFIGKSDAAYLFEYRDVGRGSLSIYKLPY